MGFLVIEETISIGEFVEDEERRIRNFARYWHEQHLENPEQFPLELEPGQWFEQYQTFDGG